MSRRTTSMLAAFESARMSAVRRRSMLCSHSRAAEVTAMCRRFMASHRRPSRRTARRHAASTRMQRSVTAHPSFPGPRDTSCAVTSRSRMIESMTAEGASMSKLASHWMATSETTPSDHIDRSRIVPERQIDRRAAPYTGNDTCRENRAAQVHAIVITEADAEARIPGFAPAQRDPAHRIHHAYHFQAADKGNQRGRVDRGSPRSVPEPIPIIRRH